MKYIGEICNLSELEVGQVAKVITLTQINRKIRRHLLDMGITKDAEVTIKKIAPMGDPISILLRDYELCICKEDLKNIIVEVIK